MGILIVPPSEASYWGLQSSCKVLKIMLLLLLLSRSVVSNSVRPQDGSPPGFPVPGILQAKVLEWGAIAFSVK